MPGLQVIKTLGALKFYSHGLTLPDDWAPPDHGHDSEQFGDVYGPDERICIPRVIPPWFRPAEPLKTFQEICDTLGADFKDFHDRMCDAVVFSHQMWKLQAKFQNVIIAGPVATGPPGCLTGPALESNIKNAPMCVAMIGYMAKYRDAVAKGVSECFQQWQLQVTVPGLPWYPPYAALPPGPAPPVPNIPMPLIACVSSGLTMITTAPPMAQAMKRNLHVERDNDAQIDALFDAIATTLSMAFMTWLPSQQVMMVLGAGSAAGFPVGPVVGLNQSTPGHLIT